MSHRHGKKSSHTRWAGQPAPKEKAVELPPDPATQKRWHHPALHDRIGLGILVRFTLGKRDPVQERRHELRLHYWIGVVLLIVCTVAKHYAGKTPPGRWLQLQAYQWLHGITRLHTTQDRPVVLVDISGMKPEGSPDLEFTPRARLQGLIQRLADAGADAIGVDIDLSPEEDGFVATNSFKLFDFSLELKRRGTPVFLGVHRMAAFGPAAWLGSQEYAPLAANIGRPDGMVLKMIYAYEFVDPATGQSNLLPSLSFALNEAYKTKHATDPKPDLPSLLHWLTEEVSDTVPFPGFPGFKAREFFVDYSKRQEIERAILRPGAMGETAPEVLAPKVRGKVVLIGDALPGKTQDTMIIPGASNPVPGAQVQACAVYTLIRSPLRELRWWAGLGFSFLVAWGALRLIQGVCWHYSQRLQTSTIGLHIILTAILFVGFFGIAWLLMRRFQVVWVEVFVVLGVLVVDCLLYIFAVAVDWPRLKGGLSGVVPALVSAPDAKE